MSTFCGSKSALRTGFGSAALPKRRSSTVTGAALIRPRQHLRLGPLGIERLRHRRLADRHPACGEAGRTLFDHPLCAPRRRNPPAPLRLAERREMPSRRSASIRLTPRRSIGITFITVCPSTKCRAATRIRGTRLGCTGGGSHRERPPRYAHHHDLCRRRRDRHDGSKPAAKFGLERLREPSRRPLSRTASPPPHTPC